MQSLEDSRINYIEQHAASAGLSEDKLSSARVSASRRSPMADTLDLCLRYLDAAMLEAVVPLLSHKVGVSADGRGTPMPNPRCPNTDRESGKSEWRTMSRARLWEKHVRLHDAHRFQFHQARCQDQPAAVSRSLNTPLTPTLDLTL